MDGGPILYTFAILLLVGLPALAVRDSGRDLDMEELRRAVRFRRAIYVSIGLSLLVVAGVTFAVARWQGVPDEALGWRVEGVMGSIGWSLGIAIAGLGLAWLVAVGARRLQLEESEIAQLLMPRDAGEKRGFLLLAGVGAVCEEYIYRGFLLHVFTTWWGLPWLAAVVTSVSFGFAHGYQRMAGILRAAVLGGILAVPVLRTGSLFPAIVAHFWMNAAIGLGAWRLLMPDVEGEPAENVAANERR
jgi:membrane protease YdiL (CAAX protease family)